MAEDNKKKKFSLSGLFFVDDGTGESQSESVKETPKAESVQQTAAPRVDVSAPQATKVAVTNENIGPIRDVLLKAMEAANLEGYDYFELRGSLKALEKVIPDEETRFKSAFVTVSTMGVSPEKLIQTAEHYLRVIKDEESKFNMAIDSKTTSDVIDKENELNQMEITIKNKEAEIRKLTEEIEQIKAARTNISSQIGEAKAKVEEKKVLFYTALNEVNNSISSDIEKIKKYICTTK